MTSYNHNNTSDADEEKHSFIESMNVWFQNVLFMLFSFIDSSILFKLKVWYRRNKRSFNKREALQFCAILIWVCVLTFLWVWSCSCLFVHGVGAGKEGVNSIDRQDL